MQSNKEPSYFDKSEIVIGLVCAVGVDYDQCLHVLEAKLKILGYETRRTSVSSLMDNLARAKNLSLLRPNLSELDRIRDRMKMGNKLREVMDIRVMGLAAIQDVNRFRLQRNGSNKAPALGVVHIFASFKRAEEIEVLRNTYGAGFYLMGLHDTEDGRLEYLTEKKGIGENDARRLMADDQEDSIETGQRTRDSYYLSDVFVSLEEKQYKDQIERFVDLLMSNPYHTPTPDEYAMFMAFGASLKSAQLGRQVGASIVSKLGDIIAVGCNDVPKPGGGQYWCTDTNDQRDHVLGFDSNDEQKTRILDDLLTRLEYPEAKREGAKLLLEGSLLSDITEFGRAMHAEMDALLSCARNGIPVADTTLYSTTFPCHNCARHILGAGVKRVVYIEPYAKSAAINLHRDGITVDTFGSAKKKESTGQIGCRIPFESFVGIGPRRYADLFIIRPSYGRTIKRKIDGRPIAWPDVGNRPRLPMHPISYLQREELFVTELTDMTAKGRRRDAKDKSRPAISSIRETPKRERRRRR